MNGFSTLQIILQFHAKVFYSIPYRRLLLLFFKAVDGCLYLTCLPFTYGRKNPKYQKKPVKACLLTKELDVRYEVELLVFVVFAKKKPFKCTRCRFLLNIYGRDTPKYKKKTIFSHYTSERVLTYKEIDEFKLTFDGVVMRKDDLKMFVLRKILNVSPLKCLATACES